ncbi:MAG TPA: endonuclease III [Bacillota bacterium]|nr:endonuclease III [Bacillota bacterium]
MRSRQRGEILRILSERYPNPKPALNFSNPFELLIATILSAQTTDKQVNNITATLFKTYTRPEDYAALTPETLEQDIRGCGLYKNKARNIVAACQLLVSKYNSQVPATREQLMELPGVGRKTANVVLSNAFGIPAIAVDTHVFRVANRIGLTSSNDVNGTEGQLMQNIARELWSDAHHWLIFFGREICHARKPQCNSCPIAGLCESHRQEKS